MTALLHPLDERYQAYLHDESGLRGEAQSISFPTDEAEIAAVVVEARRTGMPITVQGGRTGLAGAGVPVRGHVMNLSGMTRIGRPQGREDGSWVVTAEPGVTLADLRRSLAGARAGQALFWPPDPTESTATLGGVVSCNARGLTSALYGATIEHVAGLRLVGDQGSISDVRPRAGAIGAAAAGVDGGCSFDPFSLAVGGEGMFGVVTSLTLKLRVRPDAVWGICFFCRDGESACSVVDGLGTESLRFGSAAIACLEYLDRRSISLVAERRAGAAALQHLPEIDAAAHALIYAELHGDTEDDVVALASRLMDVVTACGGEADAWAFFSEAEVERLRALRHAVPEAANMCVERARQAASSAGASRPVEPPAVEAPRLDSSILTLTTDMSLPGLSFAAALEFYEAGLRREGLDACLYGPLRDNRLYVSLLPRTHDEFIRGRRLVEDWAVRAVAAGGRPVNEHGVGKLKKTLFALGSEERRRELARCKVALDPAGFWNPGNMI
jgi:D-lactate dehydrogenase (cytochrome)